MLQLIIVALAIAGANADCGKPAIPPREGDNPWLSRVVGGMEAIQGSWPWQVQMKVYGSHYCGGIILDEDWVLTAAHCVDSYSSTGPWTMHAGSHRKTSTDSNEQSRKVSRIIKHASYNYWTIDNDVALMKLSTPFTFNDYVSSVCLPSSGEGNTAGQYMYTTGFGSVQGTCCNGVLKQAMVPYVTQTQCRVAYSSLTNNMICAGFYNNGGHDACQGDSGGPLVAKKGDTWYVYGIVSWGNGCAQRGYPGVYTKVSNYISWINSNTRAQS